MRKKRILERAAEFVGEVFEMPGISLYNGFCVTLTDGREIHMTGCRSIILYSEEELAIETSGGKVSVCGEGLDVSRYNDGEITVTGKISSVIISEG